MMVSLGCVAVLHIDDDFFQQYEQDRLLHRLKNQQSKVIIFTQFNETLDLLEDYFNYRFGARYESYLRLDGEIERVHRQLDFRLFNNDQSIGKIFAYLVNINVGYESLNLQNADSIIFYDICYNGEVNLFAEDRIHRLGQSHKHKEAVVYKFLTNDTIEEKLHDINKKRIILDHFMMKNPNFLLARSGNEENDRPRRSKRCRSATNLVSLGVESRERDNEKDDIAVEINHNMELALSFQSRFGNYDDDRMNVKEVKKLLSFHYNVLCAQQDVKNENKVVGDYLNGLLDDAWENSSNLIGFTATSTVNDVVETADGSSYEEYIDGVGMVSPVCFFFELKEELTSDNLLESTCRNNAVVDFCTVSKKLSTKDPKISPGIIVNGSCSDNLSDKNDVSEMIVIPTGDHQDIIVEEVYSRHEEDGDISLCIIDKKNSTLERGAIVNDMAVRFEEKVDEMEDADNRGQINTRYFT